MKREEEELQIQIVHFIRLRRPDILFTISPITRLSPFMAKKIVKMGYTAGTPDIMIFEPSGKYKGLFFELKSHKGILSEEQKNFIIKLLVKGYAVYVLNSFEKAVDIFQKYLYNPVLLDKVDMYGETIHKTQRQRQKR